MSAADPKPPRVKGATRDRDPMRDIAEAVGATRQCKATSKTTGKQCGREAIPGAVVCRYHGGASPQVQRKAALRLLELVDPAIGTLAREMVTADKSADRQRAANSILDRAGIARKVETPDTALARELLVERLLALRGQPPAPSQDTVAGEVIP